MGTKTAVLRAGSGTSTGNVDFTTTDLGGLTPKGVLIFHNNNVLNNTVNDHATLGVGAATATDEEWAVAVSSENNVGTSDTYRYGIVDGCLLALNAGNGSVYAEANFVSFITNGVRLNFSNAPGFSIQLTFVFFAGTDVEAYAGKFDCPSSSLDITAPGFEPNLVILGQMAAPMSDATQGYAELCVGFASNETAITQGCSTWYSQDARGTMEIYGMSSALYATQSLTSSARKYGITLGSFDSNGFTATIATGAADTTDDIGYLAIKLGSGLETWVGAVDTKTSTGTQGYTGPGFKPEALVAVPTFTPAVDTHYDDGQGAAMGVSAADVDGGFCHSVADEDGAATSNSQQYSATVALHLHQDDGSAGYVASLDSLDTNGWTWNFSTANGTARKVIVLAIEGITVTEETGSFTGNAVIQKTPSGSVTANAVVQRIEAGSITAQAVIKRLDLADTFLADAVVKRLDLADTFLADAVVQRIEAGTYDADAVVQRLDLTDTFLADAVVQRIEAGTFDADAYIQSGVEVIGGDFDADAVILAVQEATLDADAVVKRLDETDTFTAEAVLQRIEAGTWDADSVIQRIEEDTFTAEAVLQRTEAGTFGADSVIQRIEAGTFDADAYLIRVITATFTADASISRTDITATFTADAAIVITTSGTFTADAQIARGRTQLFLANAVIAKYDLADTFTAEAVLQRVESDTFTADAYLVYRYEETFSADAVLFKPDNVGTFTANAAIVAAGEKLILASAVVKRIESSSFTADAVILEVDTTTGSITADAIIKPTIEAGFTGASVIRATLSGSFFADAVIKSDLYVRAGAISARAWIIRSGEPVPTPRFEVENTRPPNPRGDPKGRGYVFHMPQPKGRAGNRMSVGAVGYPWIEIIFEFCDTEVFDWYNAWVPVGDAWANIDSVQCWNPFLDGGADWVVYEGSDLRIWKPTVGAHLSGYYANVRIVITNLS